MPKCDSCRQRKGVIQVGKNPRWYCDECNKKAKECRGCHEVKSIHDFEINQRTISGEMAHRSECKACRKASRVPMKGRAAYKKKHPPPEIGDTFECPVCERMFTVNEKNVNLDHDSRETGLPRGYICADCNTGMGKMRDDVSVLSRAILWLSKPLKSFLFFL